MKVLEGVDRIVGCDLVFTTTQRSPISGFSKSKKSVDQLSGVAGWRFHDLRRTVTTGLANLGHPPQVADKILNHSTGSISGVASVYQKAAFLDERRQALEDWADYVTKLRADTKDMNDAA